MFLVVDVDVDGSDVVHFHSCTCFGHLFTYEIERAQLCHSVPCS